jgi:predicted SprT family Zn-dependent metalloprotease
MREKTKLAILIEARDTAFSLYEKLEPFQEDVEVANMRKQALQTYTRLENQISILSGEKDPPRTVPQTVQYLEELREKLIDKLVGPNGWEPWVDIVSKCEIILNPRMRSVLGVAFCGKNRIWLNARVMEKHPDELDNTFAHELAHLIVHYKYRGTPEYKNIKNHGPEWKDVLVKMGFPDETRLSTRNMTKGLKFERKHIAVASCPCGKEFKLRRLKVKRLVRRPGMYICPDCKGALKIIKWIENNKE